MPLDSSSTLGGVGGGVLQKSVPRGRQMPGRPLHPGSFTVSEGSRKHHRFAQQPRALKTKGCGLVDSSPAHPAGEPGRLPWITMKPLSTARPSAHRVHSPSITDKKEHLNKPYKPGLISVRIDSPAQSLGAGRHGRVHPPHHRFWRRACIHRRRLGMSDVQPRRRWPTPTEAPQHRGLKSNLVYGMSWAWVD